MCRLKPGELTDLQNKFKEQTDAKSRDLRSIWKSREALNAFISKNPPLVVTRTLVRCVLTKKQVDELLPDVASLVMSNAKAQTASAH